VCHKLRYTVVATDVSVLLRISKMLPVTLLVNIARDSCYAATDHLCSAFEVDNTSDRETLSRACSADVH
jgi:hypothetical protein